MSSKIDNMKEKIEYLGLDLENIPSTIKNFKPIKYRIPKFYDEKQYKQYRYVSIKNIQILLSPTNRLDDIQDKYKQASPLIDYLDNKNEDNFIKHTTFLNMLRKVKIEDIEKIEKEQENFPLYIKPVFVSQKIELGELSELTIAVKNNSNIVQGDYIVIVNHDFSAICNYIVYQVIEIEKSNDVVKLVLLKQNYINQNKEAEILSDLKEAYNGEH